MESYSKIDSSDKKNGLNRFNQQNCNVHPRFSDRSGEFRQTYHALPRYSQDDLNISYGNNSLLTRPDKKCSSICCDRENEKKPCPSKEDLYRQTVSTNQTLIDSKQRWTDLFKNSKMSRIGFRFFILFVFISVFGFILGKTTHKDNDSDKIQFGDKPSVLLADMRRPVHMNEFLNRAKSASSYHDTLRIFFKNADISDKEIDIFLKRKSSKDPYEPEYDVMEKRDYPDDDYAPYMDDPTELASKAAKHYEEIFSHAYSSCGEPRPEVIYIPPEGHRKFIPEYTILHRCRNTTGCCWHKSQTCAVKRLQVVERAFFVVNMRKDDSMLLDEDAVELRFLTNHTECSCQNVNPTPGCGQRCPPPFKKVKKGDTCFCDCVKDKLNCLQIKYGIKALDTDGFNCVIDKKCMAPTCDVGKFDLRKGYCPGSAKSRLYRTRRSSDSLVKEICSEL